MRIDVKPVKESSLISSWHWHRDDFEEQWKFLTDGGNDVQGSGNTIWQTRFKEVQLLSVPDGTGSFTIAFKSYREKRFFRYFFRPSLAMREAMGFEVVKALGIPVVDVLAFGEKRRFLSLKEAFFITRYEEGTDTLAYFKNKPGEREDLMLLLKENIRYLASLHAAGYIHGGAHPRNILWKRSGDGKLSSIWIDLATVRYVAHSSRYWEYILTDLADFTEKFRLSQEQLDELMDEYHQINDIPVGCRCRTDHESKFSEAFRIR